MSEYDVVDDEHGTPTLAIPDPRSTNIQVGWRDQTARPVIEKAATWDALDSLEGQILAVASLIESISGDQLELQKALLPVEKRRGELAGVDAIRGKHTVIRSQVNELPDDVSPMTLSRWRQIARHWPEIYPACSSRPT